MLSGVIGLSSTLIAANICSNSSYVLGGFHGSDYIIVFGILTVIFLGLYLIVKEIRMDKK